MAEKATGILLRTLQIIRLTKMTRSTSAAKNINVKTIPATEPQNKEQMLLGRENGFPNKLTPQM